MYLSTQSKTRRMSEREDQWRCCWLLDEGMTQHDCQSWWCAGFFLLLYWSTTPPEQKKTDIIHHLYKSWGKQKWHWPFINISSAKYFTTQNINIFSLEGETQQILPNPNEEYQTCTKMKIQRAHVIFCLHCNHRRMTMKHKYKIEMGCSCLRQDPSEESIFDHRYLAQT